MTRRALTHAAAVAAHPSLARINAAAPERPPSATVATRTPVAPSPAAKAAKRARGQSHAARSGLAGEALVVGVYHAAALRRGVARLTKIPTPSSGRNGELRFRARATVDCMGYTLREPLRAVCEEIKTCKAARWPLSKLEAHQAAALRDAHVAGHVAVLTVVMGALVHVVPWPTVAGWYNSDRASVTAADLAPWRVTPETYLARYAAP